MLMGVKKYSTEFLPCEFADVIYTVASTFAVVPSGAYDTVLSLTSSTGSCLRATLHHPQASLPRHQEAQRQSILVYGGAQGYGEAARGG